MLRTLPAVAAILLASVGSASASDKHVPTPSTWTLNLKASDFGGAPAPKSDVQTVTVDTAKELAWSETEVDAKGETTTMSWHGPVDGSWHPMEGIAGATASWDDKTDIGHSKMPDGTEVTNHLASVSAKQVVFHMTITPKDGKPIQQTLVYDRTK